MTILIHWCTDSPTRYFPLACFPSEILSHCPALVLTQCFNVSAQVSEAELFTTSFFFWKGKTVCQAAATVCGHHCHFGPNHSAIICVCFCFCFCFCLCFCLFVFLFVFVCVFVCVCQQSGAMCGGHCHFVPHHSAIICAPIFAHLLTELVTCICKTIILTFGSGMPIAQRGRHC